MQNKSVRQISARIYKALAEHYRLRWSRKPVVLIYQMGKVGSMALYHALEKHSQLNLFHVHRLNLDNIAQIAQSYRKNGQLPPPGDSMGIRLHHAFVQSNRPLKVITMVREPIARCISAFFENSLQMIGSNLSEPQDTALLIQRFLDCYPHQTPLQWFDVELAATLGVNVYDFPFPHEKGFARFSVGRSDVLVLKSELPNESKAEALKDFLGIQEIVLARKNVGKNKDYALNYRAFLERARLGKDYVEMMTSARYTRHFYSAEEIQGMRQRWT